MASFFSGLASQASQLMATKWLLESAIIGFVMLDPATNASIMHFITHFVITMRMLN